MNRLIMSFLLFVLISFISGCGGQSPQLTGHYYKTNYNIGEIKTVFVGQSIINVNDYFVYHEQGYNTTYIVPAEDVTLTANVKTFSSVYNLKISLQKDKQYVLNYHEKVDGILYNLIFPIDSQGSDSYGILIDDSGNIKINTIYKHELISATNLITPTNFILQPSNVKLNKKVINSAYNNMLGDVNYELIYSGINNVSMNITYREYTKENYAKTAYYQNMTFQPNAKQVRFRDFVIEIGG